MKAFLLAAGLGTRLRPITETVPKCLIPICGKPLLEWWLGLFRLYEIDEVLINLHHLGSDVKTYIEQNVFDIKFNFFEEKRLLGSAGTLRKNKNFVKNESEFFIMYADNLTNYNLSNFLNFHHSHNNPFSIALFRTDLPKSKGIVELDENKTVISFEEKPEFPKSNLANAGIYICEPELLDIIPSKDITDIGFDFLPLLVNKMSGWETNDYLLDIGTFAHLSQAEEEWANVLKTIKN